MNYWLTEVFHDFPYRWVAAFDKRRTPFERKEILRIGYTRNLCCKTPFFDRRVGITYASLAELEACKCFESSCTKWGKYGRSTNMNMERVLSEVRRATPSKLPFAERLCAAGLLTQWLHGHKAQGGSDPRVVTRADLIRGGVPLQCNKSASARGGVQASMLYANHHLAAEKQRRLRAGQPPLSASEIPTVTAALNKEFATLSDDAQQEFLDSADEGRLARKIKPASTDAPVYKNERKWGLCDSREPILVDKVHEVFMTKAEDGNRGGLSQAAAKLRTELANSTFFQDQNDIAPDEKIIYQSYCGKCHRGLCRHDDSALFPYAHEIALRMDRAILGSDKVPERSWIKVRLQAIGVQSIRYAYVASRRHADPKMSLLTDKAAF